MTKAAQTIQKAQQALDDRDISGAAKLFKEAKRECDPEVDRGEMANCYLGLGETEFALGGIETAKAHFAEALRLFKATTNVLGQSLTLARLGALARNTGDTSESRAFFQNSLSLLENSNYAAAEMNTRLELAQLEVLLCNFDDAVRLYNEVLRRASECNDGSSIARAEIGLGHAAKGRSNFSAADQHFSRAAALFKRDHQLMGEANALEGRGVVALALHRPEDAHAHLSHALRLHKQASNRTGEHSALLTLGELELGLNRISAARDHLTDAKRIARDMHQALGEANACVLLGQAAHLSGDQPAAIRSYGEAVNLYESCHHLKGLAKAFKHLGNAHSLVGQLTESRGFLLKSRELFVQIGDDGSKLDVASDLSVVSGMLNDFDGARNYAHEALATAKARADPQGEAKANDALGQLAFALGKLDESRARYGESLTLFKRIAHRQGQSNAHLGLARVATAAGLSDEARQHFNAADDGYLATQIPVGRANVMRCRGEFERLAGNEDTARSYFQEAAATFGSCGMTDAQSECLRLSTATLPPAALAPTTLVFVHGILSGRNTAWGEWKKIIETDSRIGAALGGQPSIFFGEYHTSVSSQDYRIEHATDELRSQLRNASANGLPAVLDSQRIVFIAHSLGGIVVRDLLERYQRDFSGKAVGLVLVASPSRGSAWADRLLMLSRVAHNKMAQQLSTRNDYLLSLDSRFAEFVKFPPFRLSGTDIFEHHFKVPYPKGFGWLNLIFPLREIVVAGAQSSYFGAAKIAADTDHSSVVKPQDHNHATHRYLVDFLTHTFDK